MREAKWVNPIRRWAIVLAAAIAMSAATSALATDLAPYEDNDSNYLKVIYRFVYPVGKTAELLIFRPLHVIGALSQPDPDRPQSPLDEDISACVSFRPERRCSRE
jgi:hypothetical protein